MLFSARTGDFPGIRLCWAFAGSVYILLAATAARGQCQYDVTVIQAPDVCGILGPVITIGTGLNENGEVVGYWSCPASEHDKAFVWTPETGLISLEMPAGVANARAYDIDNAGDIVGVMGGVVMPRRGFLRRGNAVVDLGTLPGGNFSQGLALNNTGRVVGYWGNNVTGPGWSAFIWETGQMTDLGALLGRPTSQATDINENGQVTGIMAFSLFEDARAYVWDDGIVTEVPLIPGGFLGFGKAINERGDVAGLGVIDDPGWPILVRHAFLWVDGQIMDLGTLPDQHRSVATDVNNFGQVVGYCDNYPESGAFTGFIWQNGQMTALNDLIPANLNLHTSVASAINDSGQIVATTSGGTVLLTPAERPLGDLDIDCAVGLADLAILLDSWGPCPDCDNCLADVDGDCRVAVPDLLALLANWG